MFARESWLGVLSFAVGLVVVSPASGSIMTFSGLGLSNSGVIPTTYGDRITSTADGVGEYLEGNGWTPNIVVDYRTTSISDGAIGSNHLLYWGPNYGDLQGVAYAQQSSGFYAEITFTADPGWEVVLNGFDLAGWPQTTYFNQPVFILEGVNGPVLQDLSGTVLGAGPSSTNYAVNVAAPQLTIRFGDNFNVGIDNINFDQRPLGSSDTSAIPEPGSLAVWGLLLMGMIFGLTRRKENGFQNS